MRYLAKIAAISLAVAPATLFAKDSEPMPRWMTGCWIGEAENTLIEECWTLPRGNMMLGSGHTFVEEMIVKHDHSYTETARTISFEHMRIERESDGKLVFWALPGGKNATRFVAVHADADDVIFENATNDYPQRVRYWREGMELKAQISLIDGSKPMDFSWKMMGSP